MRDSPERGYFVPACVWSGGGQNLEVVRMACAHFGVFRGEMVPGLREADVFREKLCFAYAKRSLIMLIIIDHDHDLYLNKL